MFWRFSLLCPRFFNYLLGNITRGVFLGNKLVISWKLSPKFIISPNHINLRTIFSIIDFYVGGIWWNHELHNDIIFLFLCTTFPFLMFFFRMSSKRVLCAVRTKRTFNWAANSCWLISIKFTHFFAPFRLCLPRFLCAAFCPTTKLFKHLRCFFLVVKL